MTDKKPDNIKKCPDMCIIDEDKICDNCCECYICDLDPNKLCDNCAKCIDTADFKAIEITEILYDNNIFKYGKNYKKENNNKKQQD